jgi:uncharacterized membrane protein YdbT with pleckstrin-like domain
MGIDRNLNSGESVVFTTRTHPKAIVFPVLIAVLVLAGAIALSLFVHGYGLLAVWVIAALLILWFTGRPVLVWLAATYTLTDRRILTRTGIFTRRGHDIPLNRISDVSYEKGLFDRLLGCGTLVISDASQQGRVALPDVPQVEKRQLQISDLLFHGSSSAGSDAGH